MIRSELDVLLDKVHDPALRADLRTQIDRLKLRRSFGLVFEQHIPGCSNRRAPTIPVPDCGNDICRCDYLPMVE